MTATFKPISYTYNDVGKSVKAYFNIEANVDTPGD